MSSLIIKIKKTKSVVHEPSPEFKKLMYNKVYTITFSDVAENHKNMQKIGTLHEHGYSLDDLIHVKSTLEAEGIVCELHSLHDYCTVECSKAYVLVIKAVAQHILGTVDTLDLVKENNLLDMDKKALMHGSVVNKKARWNLCFADKDQEPSYNDGKGRIISWKHIPLINIFRTKIAEWTKDTLLNAEANYYYNIKTCGIGKHGDAERKKVFALRMGGPLALYYYWYQNSTQVSEPIKIDLADGDMYMMSDKAVGFDWRKKKIATLRHATGCSKYIS